MKYTEQAIITAMTGKKAVFIVIDEVSTITKEQMGKIKATKVTPTYLPAVEDGTLNKGKENV